MGDFITKDMHELVSQMKKDRVVVKMPDIAYQDIQEDIINDLIAEIEAHNLITTDSPLEVQLDLENLREWLQMYYTVEKK